MIFKMPRCQSHSKLQTKRDALFWIVVCLDQAKFSFTNTFGHFCPRKTPIHEMAALFADHKRHAQAWEGFSRQRQDGSSCLDRRDIHKLFILKKQNEKA